MPPDPPRFLHLQHLVVSKMVRIFPRSAPAIPTPLLVKCIDVLLPIITKMVNISLESGHFPLAWKEALVRPILKKNGLDTVIKNYRPVSNLSFISKAAETAAFLRIILTIT